MSRYPLENIVFLAVLRRYRGAPFKGLLNVRLHLLNNLIFVKIAGALKMQEQASVIEVYTANHRAYTVAYKAFCVDKAGGVLVNFYPCRDKLLVV